MLRAIEKEKRREREREREREPSHLNRETMLPGNAAAAQLLF